MEKIKFLKNYFAEIKQILDFNDNTLKNLVSVSQLLLKTRINNKKAMIFGNGGSAAIASHFSVDLTKNARIRCTNYNESDLITCFSNDFGYERWVEKSVEFYGEKKDIAIFISASGNSQNMLNGAKKAKEKKFLKIITFTGNKKNNKLSQLGDINFWINSKSYNHIENAHQILLLSIVDLVIGKSEYLPN